MPVSDKEKINMGLGSIVNLKKKQNKTNYHNDVFFSSLLELAASCFLPPRMTSLFITQEHRHVAVFVEQKKGNYMYNTIMIINDAYKIYYEK